jgi:hypothetical protein
MTPRPGHDDLCEANKPVLCWQMPACRCAARAYAADPLPAADLAIFPPPAPQSSPFVSRWGI